MTQVFEGKNDFCLVDVVLEDGLLRYKVKDPELLALFQESPEVSVTKQDISIDSTDLTHFPALGQTITLGGQELCINEKGLVPKVMIDMTLDVYSRRLADILEQE